MDKKYFIVPAILAAIGVVAAGSLGAVNMLTAPIIKANESKVEVTAEMQEMYPNGTFTAVSEVTPDMEIHNKGGAGYDCFVHSAFKMVDGNTTAYVFDVRSETSKGTVKVYVALSGTSADDVKLEKVTMYEHSDAGYKGKAQGYVDGLNSGSIGAEDLGATKTGATLSSQCIFDEIASAKKTFIEKILGGEVVDKDFELEFAKNMYPDRTVTKDETWETKQYDNEVKKGPYVIATHKIQIINKFTASVEGVESTIYETLGYRSDKEDHETGAHNESLKLFVSFTGDAAAAEVASFRAEKVAVYSSEQSYPSTEDIAHFGDYINGPNYDWSTGKFNSSPEFVVSEGDHAGQGATQSATLVYYSILSARTLYLESHTL